MQIVQKSKRILSILTIFALCFAMLAGLAAPARAAEILPETLYMEQSRPGICTMVSAAMLLRSALYLNGSSHWQEIGESQAADACWLWGVGIEFQWTFEADYASIAVERTELCGISAEALRAVLDAHPEGVEFYCGGVPHAVLLTDYEGDTFYCADPAPYCSGRRVPLADSWLGYRLGSQESVLRNATAYWAITDCTIVSDVDETPLEAQRAEEAEAAEEAEEADSLATAKRLLLQEEAWVASEILALGALN